MSMALRLRCWSVEVGWFARAKWDMKIYMRHKESRT